MTPGVCALSWRGQRTASSLPVLASAWRRSKKHPRTAASCPNLQRERALLAHRDQLQTIVDAQTAELRQAQQEAVAASESKSCLVVSLTHELRSPLHAVIAFADLGLERKDRCTIEKYSRYMGRIKQSGAMSLES